MDEKKRNNKARVFDVVVKKRKPAPSAEAPAEILPSGANESKPTKTKKTGKAAAKIKATLKKQPKFLKKVASYIKHHKVLILTSALTAVAVVVVVIVVVSINHHPITDDYFVTDETKYVMTLTPETDEKKTPNSRGLVQTFYVYDRDGDTITGIKTYFEYVDEATAKTNYEKTKDQQEFKNAELNGKYIIVTMDKDQYKGLKTSDVEQQIENIQRFINSKDSK